MSVIKSIIQYFDKNCKCFFIFCHYADLDNAKNSFSIAKNGL